MKISKCFKYVMVLILGLSSFLHANKISEEDKKSLEIILLAKVKKDRNDNRQIPLTLDINNQLTLSGKSKYLNYNNCFTNDIINKYGSVSEDLYKLLSQYKSFLAINSTYSNYGIKNLSTLISNDVDNYFKGKDLDISKTCKDNIPTDLNYSVVSYSDVLAVPRYLYDYLAQTLRYQVIKDTHVAYKFISYDELKKESDEFSKKANKIESDYSNLSEKYTKNSNNANKDFVGSLFVSKENYKNDLKICTLEYNDIDAENVIGYRSLNEQIISEYPKKLLKTNDLKIFKSNSIFHKTFKDINSAYLHIKQNRYDCNVFVDYPFNIVKLKNALQRDDITTFYGNIYDSNSMIEKYAVYYGYESKNELDFAKKVKASLEDIKFLRRYKANNEETYNKYLEDMTKEKYSTKTDVFTVQWYIYDKENGKKANLTANQERDRRVNAKQLADKKAAEETKKRNEEFAKNYPYEAILSCGFNGSHTNIAACFVAEKYGAETTLELTNGDFYNMYKAYNLRNVGKETRQGLVIPLKKNFSIKAQNSNKTLVLNLKVKDKKTGKTLFQKSANKYGVVYYRK